MLKRIATACSECTAKTGKQGELQHRLHYITGSWSDLLPWQWLKRDQSADWQKKYS